MALFGTSVRRVEDQQLLVGDASFVADLDLPGAAVVGFVTSTVARGRIVGVDVDEARVMPGILDVLVGADVDLPALPPVFPYVPEGMVRPLLATADVRYVGEPIVAVVGADQGAVADALETVVVDIEPLPAVTSAVEARRDEIVLFPEVGTNVAATHTAGSDEELPFDDCEVVVDGTFVNQRLAPCPIETRVAAARWGDDGRLVFHASCQGAHPIRAQLTGTYSLDKADVQVLTADVGGSFGAKARLGPEELLLPLLARRCGRPVRFVPDRSADMVGLGHSRAQVQTVRIGGDRDGTLRCLDVQVVGDAGAYPVVGPNLVNNTNALMPGPYRIEHVRARAVSVLTNTTPVLAYRGAGRPEAGALIDRAVDLFAAEVGLDPLDVRLANLVQPEEFPWDSPTGLTYDSGDYPAAVAAVRDAIDHDGLRREQTRRRDAGDRRALGVGWSVFIDRTGGPGGSEYGSVELRPDGTVLARTGSSPYGQGHHTAWAMLVSDRTGLPLERIEVVHGDTDLVPRGGITGGSKSAQKAGSAIAEATDSLVTLATERAAELLEASVDDVVLDLDRGEFHVAGAPGATSVGWADLGAGLLAGDDEPETLRCESDFSGEGPTYPYGAYAAVVEVDLDTGGVDLVRLVTVDDAGTVLNPMLAMGQVHGGIGQGIAQALYEEFVYDEDGNPLTASFADYAIPTAADVPAYESSLSETPSPNNPLGFKGIAESGTIGAPPAIQNAVVDALSHLGVRHVDMPLTPERVWQAIDRSVR